MYYCTVPYCDAQPLILLKTDGSSAMKSLCRSRYRVRFIPSKFIYFACVCALSLCAYALSLAPVPTSHLHHSASPQNARRGRQLVCIYASPAPHLFVQVLHIFPGSSCNHAQTSATRDRSWSMAHAPDEKNWAMTEYPPERTKGPPGELLQRQEGKTRHRRYSVVKKKKRTKEKVKLGRETADRDNENQTRTKKRNNRA